MPKKVFVRMEEIASAEYFPEDTPSSGVTYPPCIDITLRAGGKITVQYGDEQFQGLMEALGFAPVPVS